MARPDFFDVRQCVCAALRRADRAITQTYDEILALSGLHITQFTLLAGLAQAAPISINRLAELMGMDRTTLTRNLGPLRKPGWVRVEEGKQVLAQAMPFWQQAQKQMIQQLGLEHVEALLAELSTAVESSH